MFDAIILFAAVYYYFLTYSYFGSLGLSIPGWDGSIVKMIVAILAMLYLVISITKIKLSWTTIHRAKLLLLLLIIALTTVLSTANLIYLRTQHQPHEYIHDHPLQIEEAIKFLLAGENPYTKDYLDTPMSKWNGWTTNPALYHLASLPSAIFLPLPVFFLGQQLFGWFDYRIITLLFLVIASFSVYKLIKRKDFRLIALMSLWLNPLFTPHFIFGVEDAVFLGVVLLSLLLIKKKMISLSLLLMAIAVAEKQSAWFIFPFYFYYLHQKGHFNKDGWKKILIFFGTILVIVGPFLLWDWRSFIQDIYYYASGALATSYPIKGFGISPLLVERGIILGVGSYFPFWIPQVLILTPLLIWLLTAQKRQQTLGQVMLNYGMLLWVFWFLSRFFNNTYVGLLSVIFTIGGLLWLEQNPSKKRSDKEI